MTFKLKKRSECEVSIGDAGWVYFTPHGKKQNHWAFGPNGEKYRRVLSSGHMVPCTDQEWEEGR